MSRVVLLNRWSSIWHDRLCQRTAEAIIGLHVFGDWVTTQLVISQAADRGLEPHQNELNPLLSPFADQPLLKLGVMLTIGLALVGLLVYEDRRIAQGESEQTRYGRVVLWMIIVLGVGVVLWNFGSAVVIALELV